MTNVSLAATNGPLSSEQLDLRMLIGMRKKIALAVRGQLDADDCRLRQHRAGFIDRECGWMIQESGKRGQATLFWGRGRGSRTGKELCRQRKRKGDDNRLFVRDARMLHVTGQEQ